MKKKKIEDMFNDPLPNSYPEMEDEVFESMEEDGLLPSDLRGPDAVKYEAWLSKRQKPSI